MEGRGFGSELSNFILTKINRKRIILFRHLARRFPSLLSFLLERANDMDENMKRSYENLSPLRILVREFEYIWCSTLLLGVPGGRQ